MKNDNKLQKLFLMTLILICTSNVWSLQTSEPKSINKKDVVDEINRSDIEQNNKSEAPKIDNMIPAFEMPNFKTNIKDSKNNAKSKSSINTVHKEKKINNSIKKTAKNNRRIKPPLSKKLKKQKNRSSNLKVVNKEKKKKLITIKKPLKTSQISLNDIIIFQKGKIKIQREKGNYIYDYRYKNLLPKDSEGLKLISTNHYKVTDRVKLLSDINEKTKALDNKETSSPKIAEEANLTEEIVKKRRSLEKKYNRGNTINFSIPKTKLKKEDVIYVFGDVQMVTRKKSGPSSSKKYWLYPLIDPSDSALFKIGNGRYKVLKIIK